MIMKEFWGVLNQTTIRIESIIWIVIYDCRSLRERLTKIMFAKKNWIFSYCSSFIRTLHLHFLKIFQYDNLRNAFVVMWEWFLLLLFVMTPILNLKINHNKSPINNITTSHMGLKNSHGAILNLVIYAVII